MSQTSSSSAIVIITGEKNCGNSNVFKHVGVSKNFQKDGRKADSSPKVWPPSYACAQPYHPGSGNHIVRGACFFFRAFSTGSRIFCLSFPVSSLLQDMFFCFLAPVP